MDYPKEKIMFEVRSLFGKGLSSCFCTETSLKKAKKTAKFMSKAEKRLYYVKRIITAVVFIAGKKYKK